MSERTLEIVQRIPPQEPPRSALIPPQPRFPRPRIGPGPSAGAPMLAVRAAMKARDRQMEAAARNAPH